MQNSLKSLPIETTYRLVIQLKLIVIRAIWEEGTMASAEVASRVWFEGSGGLPG